MKRLVVSLLFFGAILTLHAQDADQWKRASDEYAAGHFREAADLYQSLAKSGETSAALFYNLANAEYRLGDLGQAILNYERALALEPHHPEAEANLRLVRDKSRALELKRNAFEQFVARGTTTRYSVAAAAAFWIAAFAITGLFLARRRSALLATIAVLAMLTFAGAVYVLYSLRSEQLLAIVTAKSVDARLATADSAGTVLALPAGSEVKILSTRGDWSYAALPNDLRGWIPAKSAELVRL
ncbi:MAG: tetratricopeptide repeat protein [Chthoniobacterales bacterium]